MFLATGLLLGAATSGASPPLASLYGELQNVCWASLDRVSVAEAAKSSGWQAAAPSEDQALAAEVKQYDGEMYAEWKLRQAFYMKLVAGQRIYLRLSEGTPGGKLIQNCGVFVLGYPRAPERNEVNSVVKVAPTFASSDFGGTEYNFDALKLPNDGHLSITWLTHKVRPGFDQDQWAKQFAESVGGPERPPTLTLEVSREAN